MKKSFKLLPILLFCVSLIGCHRGGKPSSSSSSSEEPPFTTDTFVYTAAEEAPIDVKKEGCEILYIDVINIPSEGIKATKWDDYNIKFKVTYNDGTSQEFPFLTKHFPISSRQFLGEVGHHNIEMVVNNVSKRVGFDIIKNPDFKGYDCVFIDSRDGQTLYKTTVGYYKNVTYAGEIPANQEKNYEVINTFVGWNYPLEYVHQNMVYTAHYRDVEKRFYGIGLSDEDNPVIATVKKENSIQVLGYLGRVFSVPINYGPTKYHVQGEEERDNLHFNKVNPYSEMWNETNQSIFDNTLNYSFNATAAQYLLGNNSSFDNNPTFLSNFESMYEFTTKLMLLENGLMVYTSTNPGFKLCYDWAESAASESKYLLAGDDTGYYRLALTCSFDFYVSLEFEKLNNNKFMLKGTSKLFFSPLDDTVYVRKQFSENGDFGNYFGHKINYSNETLLKIAKSLDWENN